MLPVERRRPERWDGAVRSSPLNVLPMVTRRGGLACPTLSTCVTHMIVRQDVEGANGTGGLPMAP